MKNSTCLKKHLSTYLKNSPKFTVQKQQKTAETHASCGISAVESKKTSRVGREWNSTGGETNRSAVCGVTYWVTYAVND